MANRTSCTPAKQAAFLEALEETGIVSAAAQTAGLARRTIYDHRDADPAFARAWDRSLQIGLDTLQDEAIRRARDGVEVEVFFSGLRVGKQRRYSDLLLMFLLRSRSQITQSPPELPGTTINADP